MKHDIISYIKQFTRACEHENTNRYTMAGFLEILRDINTSRFLRIRVAYKFLREFVKYDHRAKVVSVFHLEIFYSMLRLTGVPILMNSNY